MVVGVNGTGKTTTCGKLARVLVADGRTVLLGAADTFRAAAADQLADLGLAGRAPRRCAGPRAATRPASPSTPSSRAPRPSVDTVLIDTAGRLHTKVGLMDELGKVKRVVERQGPVDETLLVLDATTGQNGLTQARVFTEVVDVTGIVLTKLDGTATGGIVISVQRELGVPVKLVGLGEGADDLAPFDPEQFVDALLGDELDVASEGALQAGSRAGLRAGRAARTRAPVRARSRSGCCAPASAAPTCTSRRGTPGPPARSTRRSSPATSSAARSSRSAPACATSQVGDLVSGEGHVVVRHLPQLPGRPPAPVHPHVRRSASTATARSPSTSCCPSRTSGCTATAVDPDLGAIFDPFGNAVHTALSFPLVGEDVLITGAGPIGLMAAAVARHVGARFVVITDVSAVPARAGPHDGRRPGPRRRRASRSPTAQQRLGMVEGFDVALEMSGHPRALPDVIANLNHGGRIAMLGLPAQPIEIDWGKVVTHMITIKGIYGREMFETWYAMSAMLRSGLGHLRRSSPHRFPAADWAEAFETARSGQCGKVVTGLDG